MFTLKTRMKKMFAMIAAVLTICILVIAPVKGQGMDEVYLKLITQNTFDTAQSAYWIEQHTYAALLILNSWIMPDDSSTTANLQSSFATQTNTVLTNFDVQQAMQRALMIDFYGTNVTPENVNYANDMTFGSLLGQPFWDPDPRTKKGQQKIDLARNYIKNAAGLNITHVPPGNWAGSSDAVKKYRDFYTTVSAIQSYSGYVLSQLYMDHANGGALTQQENDLMQQASSSDWFKQVATENLGTVLRQLLMYNSQNYVLMTQLLQTQKQMAATLAMTNTLIVIGDQFIEKQLVQAATTPEQQ